MRVRLQEWARQNGISKATAYRLYRAGKLPHPAERLSERIVVVELPEEIGEPKTVVYARVSTSKQNDALAAQKLRVLEYAAKSGIRVDEIVEEVGSGLNENRKKLNKLLSDPSVKRIIIEHRERLSRINYKLVESALKAQGREIIVIDDTEIEDDIVRDMTEVLTSLYARLYGRRGAKNKAEQAIKTLAQEDTNADG